MNSQRTKPWNS